MPSAGYWREIPARYRLEGARCRSCDTVVYPARGVCTSCHGRDLEPTTLSREARVVTSTTIHVPPSDFNFQAPFPMAVVETTDGARLMAQVADCDPADVAPGMKVSLEFRRIRREGHGGILCYGIKAVPRA